MILSLIFQYCNIMYLLNLFDCGSLVKDPQSNKYMEIIYTVADLGGVPRVPWNPPFGFSDDRRLWKPGL